MCKLCRLTTEHPAYIGTSAYCHDGRPPTCYEEAQHLLATRGFVRCPCLRYRPETECDCDGPPSLAGGYLVDASKFVGPR